MRIIRQSSFVSVPWRNGGGVTHEAIRMPPDGDAFQWRVSVAEVDSAAPFSAFPGIDRQIVLLDGAGFSMTLDDGRAHALTTPFVPFAFPGEAKVEVALADGPTRDFNLMLRRGRVRGGIAVWQDAGTHATAATTVLVYCARGAIDCVDGTLQAGDAWRPSSGAASMTLHPNAVALVVHVEPVA